MLFKYKTNYEKIAMGLLSFVPDLEDVAHLQDELAWYQADDQHVLYLWKNTTGDFAGVIGIEITTDYIIVRHIALSPSDRSQGNAFKMLTELTQLFPEQKLMGTLSTTAIVADWEQQH
jgi:riboflavin biosynthesis RibT protein